MLQILLTFHCHVTLHHKMFNCCVCLREIGVDSFEALSHHVNNHKKAGGSCPNFLIQFLVFKEIVPHFIQMFGVLFGILGRSILKMLLLLYQMTLTSLTTTKMVVKVTSLGGNSLYV